MKNKARRNPPPAPAAAVEEVAAFYGASLLDSPLVLAKAIRDGLPIAAFFDLQNRLELTTATLGEVLALPARTLQRRREEGRLSKEESDRLARLRRVFETARTLLGSDPATAEWFKEPQIALAGSSPLALCDTEPGAREVERLIGRIEHGVYA
jgi:putative toxin-antitoxin system antitoxin component (TIGR02293 family)